MINPPSVQPSNNFNITTYYTTTDDTSVATGSMAPITATPSTLNSLQVNITPSSSVVRATQVDYTITFTINNPIPIGGYIILGVPYGIDTTVASASGNCFASINSATPSSTTCSGTDNSTAKMYYITFSNMFQSAGVTGSSNITLKVNKIFTNPVSTEAISSFSLATYTSGNFLIDRLTEGLSVSMTTAADFMSVAANSSSNTNSQVATYTFQLNQISPMAVSSKL